MGYVYLIHMIDTNFYKIGITKRDVDVRMKELKTGNPIPLKLVGVYESENYNHVETWLHRKFKYKRQEGEWFEFNEHFINNFINECEILDKTITLLLEQNPFFS